MGVGLRATTFSWRTRSAAGGPRLVAAALLVGLVACSSDGGGAGDEVGAATTTESPTTTAAPAVEGRYREPVFEVEVTSDVVYGEAPGVGGALEQLALDVYLPVDDREDERPLAIVVHGGGFGSGDKAEGVSPVMAEHLASLGYVAASINYRLLAVGGCVGSDAGNSRCTTAAIEGIHDGQGAVRFLRANAARYGIDPDRIAISGESAGGVIATGVGTWADSPGESGTPGVPSDVAAFMSLSGGLPGCPFASAGDAPGLLFASTGDPVVPHSWSVECVDRLTALGVAAELVTYEGDVHVPFREQRDDIVDRTVGFYFEHLDLEVVT